MERKRFAIKVPRPDFRKIRLSRLLPTPGNAIFTLAILALLVAAQSAGALPLGRPAAEPYNSSTSTVAYQGRLADSFGNPLTGTYNMEFRLYSQVSSGTALWNEMWTGSNSVQVSDGLFNVMLGSLTPIPQNVVTGNNSLWLGIAVGTDSEMQPRVQLGSVPFAVQALTVPDGSVTSAKIADGAITQVKLASDISFFPADGSVTTAKLADQAVTSAKLADQAVTSAKLNVDNGLTVVGNLTATGYLDAAGALERSRSGSFSSTGVVGTYPFSGNFVGLITVVGMTTYSCCFSSIHHYQVLALNTQSGNSNPQIQELGAGLVGSFDGTQRINVVLQPTSGGVNVVATSASTSGMMYKVMFTIFSGDLTN